MEASSVGISSTASLVFELGMPFGIYYLLWFQYNISSDIPSQKFTECFGNTHCKFLIHYPTRIFWASPELSSPFFRTKLQNLPPNLRSNILFLAEPALIARVDHPLAIYTKLSMFNHTIHTVI